MRSKYKIPIILIATLLGLSLVIGTSYGLYKVRNEAKPYTVFNDECLEIVTFDNYVDIPQMPILNTANGKTTHPYTIAITNTCSDIRNIELRFNVLASSNIKKSEVMIYLNGDMKIEPTILSSFINSASNKKDGNLLSKILGNLEIPANSTKRINIRTWLDDTRVTNQNQSLQAMLEISKTKTDIKPIFKDTILAQNQVSTDPLDFSISEAEYSLLATTEDENGTSYYFRGNTANNYVSFAGYLWQIVRINGDGSIRLIYADNNTNLSTFSSNNSSVDYVGLTYLQDNVNTNNTITEYLNAWYQDHLKDYDKYIAESTFCNDTTFTNSYGPIYFGAYNRLYNNNPNPTLICPKNDSEYGGSYSTKIGLISADEVILAGGHKNQTNTHFYLYTGYDYYTLSPSRFSNNLAYMLTVNSYGRLSETPVSNNIYIRPVISLESTVSVSGDGSITNPYRPNSID